MAFRRQRLSQRRKAVGFTQESLAERLGVERSTVVRWEAGDTEPLPSIRPNLASALQVSLDQLAELLTSTDGADATSKPAPSEPSGSTEVTVPELLAEPPSQPPRDPAEPTPPICLQPAETVETLRQTLRAVDVSPEFVDALLLVCGVSRVPLVTQLLSDQRGGPVAVHADPPADPPVAITLPELPSKAVQPADIEVARADVRLDTLVPITVGVARFGVDQAAHVAVAEAQPLVTTPIPRPPATSRSFTRFVAAGVLVLAGIAASVPFLSSPKATTAPAPAGAAAPRQPEVALPAPNPGASNGNTPPIQDVGVAQPAPAAPAREVAAAPAPRNTRTKSSSRPRQPTARTSPPRNAEAEQARAWAQQAALSAREQAARLRSRSPSWP